MLLLITELTHEGGDEMWPLLVYERELNFSRLACNKYNVISTVRILSIAVDQTMPLGCEPTYARRPLL